ncbi:MAG: ABC transporter permease [Thermomicrobiales bacterium]|nr:MAG: ABC transporter permease [Thermomicrobiales bacterium]
MVAYIVRRVVIMIPVLFALTLFTFLLVRLVPGNPASTMLGPRATPEAIAAIEESLGLDKPLLVQYGYFMRQLVLHRDMGESIRKHEPVSTVIADRIGATLFLTFYSMVLAVLITVPLATVAALNRERWPDQIVRAFTLCALAMPAYWVGMMLLQLLAVKYRLFPVAGYGDGFFGHLHSLFLPAISLALAIAALTIRSLRSSILETLGSDHVRTARAKGLSSRRVFLWHVMRNSSLSSVTLLGLIFVFVIGGTTIMETIFSIPGIGQLIVRGIFDRDYPVIQGVTLVIGIIVLVTSLAVDIIYAFLDPRVTLS